MSQRDKDNSFIKQEIIGHEFNDKLNDLMYDHFARRKFESLGFQPRPGAIAMVHTIEDNMLKAVGASAPGDIINSNFGKWLAAFFAVPSNAFNDGRVVLGQGLGVQNTGNGTITTIFGSNQGSDAWNTSGGGSGFSYIQIGKGTTAPDIDDFDIETPFPGGAEANKTILGLGSYAPSSGRTQHGTNIGPVSTNDTITEMGLFTLMALSNSASVQFFMMSHDAIAPALPFTIGETIFAQYFFQL